MTCWSQATACGSTRHAAPAAAAPAPPRRRAAGPPPRRPSDPEAPSPPYSFVLDLATRVPATGAKLAPGIAHRLLPPDAEAQWVSVAGDVVECALWSGPLARE